MLKRCLSLLLAAVCVLLTLPLAARADVIIEPDNSFYARNQDACVYHDRSYYINGVHGRVSVKKEPGSSREIASPVNGTQVTIRFTYNHMGEDWGVCDHPAGWIPMADLVPVYDYLSFSEDFGGELYTYSGSYDSLLEAEEIILWSWPGSGESLGKLERLTANDLAHFSVSSAYTDPQGREWGYVGYWYGRRHVWICLSSPGDSAMPAFNPPPQPELWPYDPDYVPEAGLSVPLLAVLLVAALVVGTAVLIRVLWRPGRDKG